MREFQLPGCQGRGFNADAEVFMDNYFEPFSQALQALLSNTDAPLVKLNNNTEAAHDRWARQAMYNMLCFPKQGWRTAAILAIKIAQSSNAAKIPLWLRSFMRELECLAFATVLFSMSQKQQGLIYGKLITSLKKV